MRLSKVFSNVQNVQCFQCVQSVLSVHDVNLQFTISISVYLNEAFSYGLNQCMNSVIQYIDIKYVLHHLSQYFNMYSLYLYLICIQYIPFINMYIFNDLQYNHFLPKSYSLTLLPQF